MASIGCYGRRKVAAASRFVVPRSTLEPVEPPGDPDATRKVNAFRLAELAASLPDETSPFPIVDVRQIPRARPTPAGPMMPVTLATRRDQERSRGLGALVLGAIVVVTGGIVVIAAFAHLLP
jgi:hypothetical protein